MLKKAARETVDDLIRNELLSNPQISITAWADPTNDTREKICLGFAKVPIKDLTNENGATLKEAVLDCSLYECGQLNVSLKFWFVGELPNNIDWN